MNELKIKTPQAKRVFTASDASIHETESLAKKHEIVLAARLLILDSLPAGKLNLTPKECAQFVLEKSALFRELINRFTRLK